MTQKHEPGAIQSHRREFIGIDPLAPLRVYEQGTNTLDNMFTKQSFVQGLAAER